ncbi:hypothetical protein PCC7424_5425 [Rivularia sp. IAM M-261]|nr:hypothetical protein PCC7424_5425 [Rivularia sp. IAM M-261]
MSDSDTVYYPVYYRIVERRNDGWAFGKGKPFLNLFNAPWLSHEALLAAFGTSTKKIAIELFRINGGKQGYYIANILDKKYYYCGAEWDDVRTKLQELGICKPDPLGGII